MTALNAEIPAIRIIVSDSSSVAAKRELTIDGMLIDGSRWSGLIELSPGDHVAVLLDNDSPMLTKKFSLKPGDRTQVIEMRIALKSGPSAVPKPKFAASRRLQAPAMLRAETKAIEHPHRIAATVALGMGVVGVAIGAVCGVWAWHERNALLDRCVDHQCPPEEQARWHRADRTANIATAALIVGGLNLSVGGYLFYFAPSTGPSRNRNGAAASELSLGLARSF